MVRLLATLTFSTFFFLSWQDAFGGSSTASTGWYRCCALTLCWWWSVCDESTAETLFCRFFCCWLTQMRLLSTDIAQREKSLINSLDQTHRKCMLCSKSLKSSFHFALLQVTLPEKRCVLCVIGTKFRWPVGLHTYAQLVNSSDGSTQALFAADVCSDMQGRVVFFFFASRQGLRAKSMRESERKKTNTEKKTASHPMAAHVPSKSTESRHSTCNWKAVARYPKRTQFCRSGSEDSSQ